VTDLVLACLHHLLAFGLVAHVAAQTAVARRGLDAVGLRKLGRLDLGYGISAGLLLIVGFTRVYWGAKGPGFYLHNPVFHTKLGAFLLVGLLSILPTVRIAQWRKRGAVVAGQFPPVRGLLLAELGVLACIPVLAAAMARGYGL
jgi:putative membrane protein